MTVGPEKTKGSATEAKREVIDFMENREVHGRYLSGKLPRKNRSIKWMRANRRKLQDERENLRSGLQKEERQEKFADLRYKPQLLRL
jgi:hypothetical protein